MTTTTKKIPVDYFEFADGEQTTFIVLDHRRGRFPIQRSVVTAAGSIEITGHVAVVEVLGSATYPCSSAILKRIRTHHEGLLFVQIDSARLDGVTEQMLSARFY